MTLEFQRANAIESTRFTAQIAIPNVVQGLFRRRTLASKAAAAINLDGAGYALMEGLAKKYGPDPFWVKVVTDDTLILTHAVDIKQVLSGSVDNFASDPDAKAKGMAAFQPEALTISRGDVWRQRRAFAEAVLETGTPLHRFAQQFVALAREEADALVGQDGAIDFETFNLCVQRLTRCVIFGRLAADDAQLSERVEKLMDAGNSMPGKPAEGYDALISHISRYLEQPEADSLAALVASAPATSSDPAGQLIHWMFAMGDTLAANAYRCLIALAAHPAECDRATAEAKSVDLAKPAAVGGLNYLAGCLQEAMRLWPTTSMFGRVTLRDLQMARGVMIPAGTPILIVNSFNHRNQARVSYADAFTPTAWTEGDAPDNWLFNFFSHGTQGCPGVGLAMLVGQALLAQLLVSGTPTVEGSPLKASEPLPYALEINGLSVNIS